MCKRCDLLFISLLVIIIIAFSSCNYEKGRDEGNTFIETTLEDYQLTNCAYSESDKNILSIQNTKEWVKWNVTAIEGEEVIKQSEELVSSPVGTYPPALRIGESIWNGYSVSFDFYIGRLGNVSFVLYDNSNIFCPENSFFEGEQRFWFNLDSDGRISFQTTSVVDSYYLKDDDEYLQVNDFDPNVWNTVTLNNINNNLILIVNGVEIGTIYQFDGSESGKFALDGSAGCMFKNICIE